MCVIPRTLALVWRVSPEYYQSLNETSVLSLQLYFRLLWLLVKFLATPETLILTSPHLHVILQYVYETNEHGDKVVLGKGTYGVVYAGRDLSNQVRIAIKEIPEKDSTYGNNND